MNRIPLAIPLALGMGGVGAVVGIVIDKKRKRARPLDKERDTVESVEVEDEFYEDEPAEEPEERPVVEQPAERRRPHATSQQATPKELEGVTRRLKKYVNKNNEAYYRAFLKRSNRLVTLYDSVMQLSVLKPPVIRFGDIATANRLLTRALEALSAFRQRVATAWKEDADVVIDEWTQFLEAYASLIRQTITSTTERCAANGTNAETGRRRPEKK